MDTEFYAVQQYNIVCIALSSIIYLLDFLEWEKSHIKLNMHSQIKPRPHSSTLPETFKKF